MSQYATLQQANENTQQRTQHDINNLGLQQIPKTDSTTLLTFQNLGKLAEFCATRGDYQLAIEYYKHMTNLQPDNGPSWMALGHCCLLTDEIHQAFNAY
jgi:Flp pilus assembly protein TadD